MSKYQVRAARLSDLDEVIRLCAEHAAYERASYDPAGKAERLAPLLFGPNPRLHCLVLEGPDRRLMGYATYTLECSTWDADYYFHVDCLYLREEVRSRGIGWAMGKRLAQEMVKAGVPSIQFQTPPFNTQAIRIYEAMGAKQKEKVRFYATRDDALRFIDPAYRVPRAPSAEQPHDSPPVTC